MRTAAPAPPARRARYVRRGLVVAQVALAFVLLIGAGLLLASFRQLLGVDPGFDAEHVLTGRVSPLRAGYPDDAALRTYVRPRARAYPRAAGRRGCRRQHLPPVQLGRQQQRHHSRGICDGAGRIGRLAEPAAGDARLSRSAARSAEARTLLHGERSGRRTARGHRRRAARQQVLAECRSDRPPHVSAATARGRREAGPHRNVAAGGRRCRGGEAQRTRRGRRGAGRRVLFPYAQAPSATSATPSGAAAIPPT